MLEQSLTNTETILPAETPPPAADIQEKTGDASEHIPIAPPKLPPNTPAKDTSLKNIFGSQTVAPPSTTAVKDANDPAAPAEPAQLMKPENAERLAGYYVKYAFPFLTGLLNSFFIRTSKPEILELTRSEDEDLKTATVDLLLTMRDFGSPGVWFALTNASLLFGIHQRASRDKQQEAQAQELIRLKQAKQAAGTPAGQPTSVPDQGSPLIGLYNNLPSVPPQEIGQERARWETRYISNNKGGFDLHYTYTPKGKSEYLKIEDNNASTLVSEPFRAILEHYGIDTVKNKKGVPNGKSLNYPGAAAECNKYASYFFEKYQQNAV